MKTHYPAPSFKPVRREDATGQDRGESLCGYVVRVATMHEPGGPAQPSCPVCRRILKAIRQAPDEWREVKISKRIFTEAAGTPSGPPTGYRAPAVLGKPRPGFHGTAAMVDTRDGRERVKTAREALE